LGNILSKSDVGSYTYATSTLAYLNPDAVASIGNTNYTYDNNGNLTSVAIGTSSPTSTYAWDYNNRLTQADVGSTNNTYAYDYQGQRVESFDGTTTTIYPTQYYNTGRSMRNPKRQVKKHLSFFMGA